jgi:Putative transposase
MVGALALASAARRKTLGIVPNAAHQAPRALFVGEFIRRFLIHVLPKGFHRIRHHGLLASANRRKETMP